jgi:hypothetical protein
MAVLQTDSFSLLNHFIHLFPHEEPRFERKFRMRASDGQIAFSHLLNIGFSTIYDPRQVNSIYYDKANFQFARENIDGERYRVKPRLRWYGDKNLNNQTEASLEYKFRDSFIGYKYRKKILRPLLEYQNIPSRIENDLFCTVTPTIKISYEREYFYHTSGIRATIDRNISAQNLRSDKSSNFFSLGYDVLEFKYPIKLDNYFRDSLYGNFSNLAPYRLNKSSKYIEGLLVCQSLF